MATLKAVITDYDFGDLDIERAILEPAGIEVVGLQAKSEDDLLAAAGDCDAMVNQYARVGARTIAAMTRCKVIAVMASASTSSMSMRPPRAASSSPMSATIAPRRWLTTPSRSGWRPPGASSNMTGHPPGHLALAIGPAHPPVLRGQVMGSSRSAGSAQAIAERRRKAFGVEIVVFDPYVAQATLDRHGVRQVDKATLLAMSDIIVMHRLPMTAETAFPRRGGIPGDQAGRPHHQYRARSDHRQHGAARSADRRPGARRRP